MRAPTTYRPIRHPARPRYRVAALARRYAGETASGRVARCQQDARCDPQELSRLLPTPEPAARRDGTSARERLRALCWRRSRLTELTGKSPEVEVLRRQVAELQAELIHLRAVMSGQVKMLPAPPRRQCRTRVGKIPQPKREKPSTSSPPKMVARKIPHPPLRRLPPAAGCAHRR
jgi:hypothetical protein